MNNEMQNVFNHEYLVGAAVYSTLKKPATITPKLELDQVAIECWVTDTKDVFYKRLTLKSSTIIAKTANGYMDINGNNWFYAWPKDGNNE